MAEKYKYSFQCSDGGVSCGAKMTGETREEVVEKAVEHAQRAHGVDLRSSRTLTQMTERLVRAE